MYGTMENSEATGNSKTVEAKVNNPYHSVTPAEDGMFNFVMSKKGDPIALKEQELNYFDTFLGPATAVNMFSTSGFEKTYIEAYKAGAIRGKKTFIGGSFGSFRFCALLGSLLRGVDLVTPFHDHVIGMTYRKGDTPDVLKPMLGTAREIVASDETVNAILHSKQFSLGIIVARLKPCISCCGTGFCLKVGLASMTCCNLCCRCSQGMTYERLLFYSGDAPPESCPRNHFAEFHKLTPENFRSALAASSMIPGVTPPVNYIEGVGKASYIDAAISDFQVGFRVTDGYRALVVTAVEDSRKISRTMMDSVGCCHGIPNNLLDNTCVIHPTASFRRAVSPKGGEWEKDALPNLNDWFNKDFVASPSIRQRFWRKTKSMSENNWTFGIGMKA
jgi:hypothetical protein